MFVCLSICGEGTLQRHKSARGSLDVDSRAAMHGLRSHKYTC